MRTLSALCLCAVLGTPAFAQFAPVLGDVVITELMANPKTVSDENGEYFEICNVAPYAIDLNGCSFTDLVTSSVTVVTITSPIIVQPGELVVFIRNAAQATTWGITSQVYAYITPCAPVFSTCVAVGAMNFGNSSSGDGVEFRNASSVVLDAAGFGPVAGTPYAGQFLPVPTPTGAFDGGAYCRKDLRLPWGTVGNVVAGSATIDANNFGNPGTRNSADLTVGYLRNLTPATIGTTCNLAMLWPAFVNEIRFLAASGGTTGFNYGGVFVGIDLDAIFNLSIDPAYASIFAGFGISTTDAWGESSAALVIPFEPSIVGITIYFEGLLIDSGFNIVRTSDVLPATFN